MSTKAVSSGALLKKTLTKTAFFAATLSKRINLTVTVSAVVQGYTKGLTVHSVLRATMPVPIMTTGALLKTVQGSFSANVVSHGRVVGTFAANAVIKRGRKRQGDTILANGIETSFSTDAALFPATATTTYTTIIRIVVQRRGITKTVATTAVLVPGKQLHTKTVAVSVYTVKLGAKLTVQMDMVLIRSGARTPKQPFSSFRARTPRRQ